MNKVSLVTVFLASALLLASAPFAHAQVYGNTYGTTVYPTSTYNTPVYGTPTYSNVSNSSCIVLTAPMTIGASDYLNGGQVSELQTFLVRDGVLSSAYITGFYGNLTANAVSQFQASRGIAPVGVVGPATRAAIQQVSCGNGGGYVSPANPIYPTNPIYPNNPINPGGPIIFSRPDLNSLSVSYNTGTPVITIQGYGFSPTSNTVYFGNQAITNVSSNGSQITFNVPNIAPGNYSIYVTNSYGSSNSLSYTVGNNNGNGGSCYLNGQYTTCNGCVPTVYNSNNSYNVNSSYNNCGTNNGQSITITSVNSTNGLTATVYGSGFTNNGNTVYMNNQAITNVYSSNGTSLTFSIPQQYTYNNYNGSMTYTLYVVNGNGTSSNSIQFTLNNNNGGYNNNQVNISYLSPTQGSTGTQIAIQGSGFSQYGNIVHFGNGGTTNVSSTNGSTIYFTIPTTISPCSVTTNGGVCAQYIQQVTAGSYPIYVTNQNGATSNTLNFQVFTY